MYFCRLMYTAYSVVFLSLDDDKVHFCDMLRSHLFILAVCLVTQTEANICLPAVVAPSPLQHLWASDGLEVMAAFLSSTQVSKIAFSSCFLPSAVKGATFWSQVTAAGSRLQVRAEAPDLWLWLGDNAYSDGTDMDHKRRRSDKGPKLAI